MITVNVKKYYEVTIGKEEPIVMTAEEYREFYNDHYLLPDPDDKPITLHREPVNDYWPLTCGVETKEAEKYCVTNKLLTVDEVPEIPYGTVKEAEHESELGTAPEPEAVAETKAEDTKDEPVAEAAAEVPELEGKVEAPGNHSWTKTDFSKYIAMKADDKVILSELMKDFSVSKATAHNVFKRYVKGKSLDKPVRIIKQPEVTIVKAEPKIISRVHIAEIVAMPDYKDLKAFKNAVCERPHLINNYDIKDMRNAYLNTHPEARW